MASASSSAQASAAGARPPTVEMDHAIGYTGALPQSLHQHPNMRHLVYVAGACVVVADTNDTHNQVFLNGHDDDVTALAMSPTGALIASGQLGENSDVIVWDFESKRLKYRLEEHNHGVSCLAFSHDERLLATVGEPRDRKLFMWDMRTGNIVANMTVDPVPTLAIAFGGMVKDVKRRETSQYQFVTIGNSKLRMWSLDPRQGAFAPIEVQFGSHVRDYTCVCFSPDYEMMFAGSSSGDVSVFILKHMVFTASVPVCSGGVRSVLALPSGAVLVGGGDGSISRLEGPANRMQVVWRTRIAGAVASLSLSSDLLSAVAGTSAGSQYRFALNDGQAGRISEAHASSVTSVAFPPDMMDRFATCSLDGTVRYWDIGTYGVVSKSMCRAQVSPTSLGFTGPCIVAGATDGNIYSFDMDSGEPAWSITNAHKSPVSQLAVSHNEKFVVSGADAGEIRMWDVRTREMAAHLKQHTMTVTSLNMFLNDYLVLSSSRDRYIFVWDLRNETRVTSLRAPMSVNDTALFEDQTRVLSVGADRRVTFWDLRVGQATLALADPHGDFEPTVVSLAHNNRLFATGGSDSAVRVWDVSGREIACLRGHSKEILAIEFSPDDKQMVSVGSDGNIFVWNLF